MASTATQPAKGTSPSAEGKKKRQSTWTIRGKCYDLTEWISRHPGGTVILGQTKNTDCTFLFDSYHLTNLPTQMLAKYLVDVEPTNERASQYASLETKQYDEMKLAVRNHFKTTGQTHKAPPVMQAYYAMWAFFHFAAIYQLFYTGSMLYAVILGCSSFYFSADVLHCGMHYCMMSSPALNVFTAYFCGMFHHVPGAWVRQHNLGHHPYTNHPQFDPDCRHFSVPAKMYGAGWRLNTDTKWIPAHEKWAYFWPLMVSLTGVGPLVFESLLWLCTGSYMGRVVSTTGIPEITLSVFQLCLFLTYYGSIVASWGATRALVPVIIHGMLYYGTSQVSHANSGSQQGNDVEWCVKQFKSSAGDYSWKSRITLFCSIGLNLQSVHHVFPAIHWWHYPDIYPIICKSLGQPLTKKSYATAVVEHLSFVNELNSPKGRMPNLLRSAHRRAQSFATVSWGIIDTVLSFLEQSSIHMEYETR